MTEKNYDLIRMPLLALRGLSVFPGMLLTFDVERPASVASLAMAAQNGQLIFLTAQKDLTADMPKEEEIYHVGTVCRVRQQLRQPHAGMCRVMVEGLYRAEAVSIQPDSKGYTAQIHPLPIDGVDVEPCVIDIAGKVEGTPLLNGEVLVDEL